MIKTFFSLTPSCRNVGGRSPNRTDAWCICRPFSVKGTSQYSSTTARRLSLWSQHLTLTS